MRTDQDQTLAERALAQLEQWRTADRGRILSVECTQFDDSYLDFLDEQIRLSPRGPEWTARLSARRAALAGWSNRPLMAVRASASGSEFWVKVDPATEQIIFWEEYGEEDRSE